MNIQYYWGFSCVLFCIALFGMVAQRKNLIILLMCIELLLLAVNTSLITFSQMTHNLKGQILVFFVLTVAAVESAVGLALLVLIFRKRHSIDSEEISQLNG